MPNKKPLRTTKELLAELNIDSGMREKFERAPLETLVDVVASEVPDTRVYRMVVGALGLGMLISLIAVGWITIDSDGTTEVPSLFATAASTIVGAMAGLLAPQP